MVALKDIAVPGDGRADKDNQQGLTETVVEFKQQTLALLRACERLQPPDVQEDQFGFPKFQIFTTKEGCKQLLLPFNDQSKVGVIFLEGSHCGLFKGCKLDANLDQHFKGIKDAITARMKELGKNVQLARKGDEILVLFEIAQDVGAADQKKEVIKICEEVIERLNALHRKNFPLGSQDPRFLDLYRAASAREKQTAVIHEFSTARDSEGKLYAIRGGQGFRQFLEDSYPHLLEKGEKKWGRISMAGTLSEVHQGDREAGRSADPYLMLYAGTHCEDSLEHFQQTGTNAGKFDAACMVLDVYAHGNPLDLVLMVEQLDIHTASCKLQGDRNTAAFMAYSRPTDERKIAYVEAENKRAEIERSKFVDLKADFTSKSATMRADEAHAFEAIDAASELIKLTAQDASSSFVMRTDKIAEFKLSDVSGGVTYTPANCGVLRLDTPLAVVNKWFGPQVGDRLKAVIAAYAKKTMEESNASGPIILGRGAEIFILGMKPLDRETLKKYCDELNDTIDDFWRNELAHDPEGRYKAEMAWGVQRTKLCKRTFERQFNNQTERVNHDVLLVTDPEGDFGGATVTAITLSPEIFNGTLDFITAELGKNVPLCISMSRSRVASPSPGFLEAKRDSATGAPLSA